ncbi:cation diffusion facilitator family transporter [Agreia sp. VKM Ac-1783]|uniref:cation diffusion facilitator family transporter n=1 Tax=Agreia sp. VKM Ac-1783 TaxID=1938889 RepID=UPI000A2AA7F4|nr:cation diffusion facilitator family transporter [Agreia sp. VKM Ac-1783]SMQ68158.1 cobalt-zinc-cadmium efflux system protein [Agreia sp. VKM Ac-1783]
MASTEQHSHGSHDHASTTNRTRLAWAIGIVAAVLVVEVGGALATGSLALLADAGHMASDLIGLTVALVATVIAARPATDRHSFGFQRVEVFAALFNGLLLIGVAAFVAIEGVSRLITPGDVSIPPMPLLIVAVIGLVANFGALMLLRGGADSSLNMRGAYLEVFGDLLGSATVIVASIVILATGFAPADAIASLVIAAMIIPRALSLLRDVIRVLLQQTPVETDVAEIRSHILAEDGVVDVHDVHVWAVTTGKNIFSAHVVVDAAIFERGESGRLLDRLSTCLSAHFDVGHSTFQIEPAEHARHEEHLHP